MCENKFTNKHACMHKQSVICQIVVYNLSGIEITNGKKKH